MQSNEPRSSQSVRVDLVNDSLSNLLTLLSGALKDSVPTVVSIEAEGA
jgi:hypothetical protein